MGTKLNHCYDGEIKSYMNKAIAHRWYLGIGLWLVLVLFQIHGSSIGLFADYLNEPELNTRLLGFNRIRLDDWDLYIPMLFSQYEAGSLGAFAPFNEFLRAYSTDVSLIYSLPSWNYVTVFRPFLWGFFCFSPAYGLSFYWVGRLIVLFLISWEFGRYLTKSNNQLALCYSILITFSPAVHWWIDTNSFVEMLIFSQSGIFALIKYGEAKNRWRQLAWTFALVYSAIAFCLSVYPAWQIPLGYVYLVIAVWVFHTRFNSYHWKANDSLFMGMAVILIVASISYIVFQSQDAISLFRNSEYPGKRFETGGNLSCILLFRYFLSYILPYDFILPDAQFNLATFIGFSPLGIALAVYGFLKTKSCDFLIGSLIIVNAVFCLFCVVPFPKIICQLLLLNPVSPRRLVVIIDYVNVIILIRVLAVYTFSIKKRVAVLITGLYVIFAAFIVWNQINPVLRYFWMIPILAFSACTCLYIVRYPQRLHIMVIMASIVSILIINPIACGVQSIYGVQLGKEIKAITSQDNGKWVVDYMETLSQYTIGIMNNYPIIFGAPTINSTNPYVCWPRWDPFNFTDEQKRAINRYCFMNIRISDLPTDVVCTNISDQTQDRVLITLNYHDLQKIDARYILTNRDLSIYNERKIGFSLLSEADGLKIYRVYYQDS